VREAELPRPEAGVVFELTGRDPPVDGKVELRRLEVLADGQQVAAGIAKVAHCVPDLVGALAHAEDEVRLRHLSRPDPLRDAQDVE
jgi:hypothetical protein